MRLKAVQAQKFKVTTDSNHDKPVAPDLIEQDFSAHAPDQKWVSDISIYEYIETYYNRQRKHSAIGNQIPMLFEIKKRA